MPYHMLVVFDRETAHPPVGLESFVPERKSSLSRWPDEEEGAEAACRAALERTYSNSKPEMRKLELLGHGNGFTFEASPFCSYAHRDGVHVLMGGEVSVWPSSINAVNMAHDAFMRGSPPAEASDAHWLLDYYASFMMGESEQVAQQALECLSQVQGSFAFVIYDATQHRVFAARDTEGAQPLFWGVTNEGQLLFGSHVADLEGCNPSATAFPGGTLFASESHTLAYSPGTMGWVIQHDDYPGRMLSFIRDGASWRNVRAIPRVTPEGALCGAVYKVGSAHHLAGAAQ